MYRYSNLTNEETGSEKIITVMIMEIIATVY